MKRTKIASLVREVQSVLSPDLLKPKYRAGAHKHPHWGHCYGASEALWHLLGAERSGWTACYVSVGGGSHWFLRRPTASGHEVLDPTAGQFEHCGLVPDYEQAKGCGFPGTRHDAKGRCLPGSQGRAILERLAARQGKTKRRKNPLPWFFFLPTWPFFGLISDDRDHKE